MTDEVELLPCIQCGSPADDIDYTRVTEFYGMESQTGYINCSGDNKHNCPISVGIDFEQNGSLPSIKLDPILKAAWNLLNTGE